MKAILLGIIGFLLLLVDRRPNRRIIRSWSKLFHMKVKYHNRYTELFSVDVMDDILYISRYNKAVHDKKEYLYSIAHEFGHLLDYAYKEYYYDDEDLYTSLTDRKAIYQDEVSAWDIAEILLRDAAVLDEKVFFDLKERCLEEYRVALKLTSRGKKKKTKKKKTRKKKKSAKKSKQTK